MKSGQSDAIAIVDVRSGDAVHYRVPEIDAIISVKWSPDGGRIAFEGTHGPQSDLYVLDLATGETVNYTADLFSDHEPAWSPDGRALVFHSDRGDYVETGRWTADNFSMLDHDYAQLDLYRLDLDAPGRLDRLTFDADWDEQSAAFGSDPDRLLFVSDRNGVYNLWEKNLATGEERPLTNLLTGVTQVSLSADGTRAALVALKEGVPSIYLLRDPFGRDAETAPLRPTVWAQRVEGESAEPAPALALAGATTLDGNPILRDAANDHPFLADPMRARRLPEPLVAAAGTAAETVGTNGHSSPALGDSPDLLASGDGTGDGVNAASAPDSTAYGTIRVDFRNYDFSDAFDEAQRRREEQIRPRFEPVDNVNEDGSFKEKRYKLKFSPDIVYGNVGYDAIFGVQSVTQMVFSDMLGNHQIFAATNLIIDLRNSDYLLAYQYLPRRTDFALTGFHLARQLTDFTRETIYRYRNYGLTFSASYPLDKFRRVDAEMSVLGTSLTDLVDPALRARSRVFLYPALTFTTDGTEPGFLFPSGGRRYALRLAGSPGVSVTFATLLADARQYVGLGRYYSFAFRASGGVSVGPNPQRFYAAGVQNWINPNFRSIPIEDENDFVFGTPVLPLRGFGIDERSGSAFGLLNAEFRFPLFAAILPGPIPVLPLYNLQGTAFLDAGTISNGGFDLRRLNEEGKEVFDDLLIGTGVGLRTILLGYPIRLDWAWPYDGRGFGDAQVYFSIGLDF